MDLAGYVVHSLIYGFQTARSTILNMGEFVKCRIVAVAYMRFV